MPDETPETTVTGPQQEPASDPAEAASPQQVMPTPVKPRTLESLNLKLKDRPVTAQTPPAFGVTPDSGWLDRGREDAVLEAEENGLLPDLFEQQASEKPVDIKTRVLVDDGDISAPLDGAEMSIEIKTD